MTGDVIQTWKTAYGDTVEVWRAADGFRYRVKARNGKIGDIGGEAYTRSDDAATAATRHHPDFGNIDELVEQLVDGATEDETPEVELLTDGAPPATVIGTTIGGSLIVDRRAASTAEFVARMAELGENVPGPRP